MKSMRIMHAAERLAQDTFNSLTQEAINLGCDSDFRHKCWNVVKHARTALPMARAIVMFARMQCGADAHPSVAPWIAEQRKAQMVVALMLSAKSILYQHYLLNSKKYGLHKKKALDKAPSINRRRRG